MYDSFGLFIGGAWRTVANGKTMPVIDPAMEETLGAIPVATADDLDDALLAASRAARSWAGTPGWERSAILRCVVAALGAQRKRIARMMSAETGKPLAEANGEATAAIEQFDWYVDEARRIYGHTLAGRDPAVTLHVRYQPVGPVAAFSTWNFPALLPARKIAAGLAAGCPVIIKPSEEAPRSAFLVAEVAQAADVPEGVLNVVTGDAATIAAHLIASPVIRKVSLTGSVPVGKHILRLCADGVNRVSMELGGHAPVLVFPDWDPVAASELCARSKFRNAGQVCISPSRFYGHSSVYELFAKKMTEVVSSLRLGPGLDGNVDVGPMAKLRGRERIVRLVEAALRKGAELLTGGHIPADRNRGFFFEPTVIGRVSDDAAIMREEPFGPVAPIAPFEDFDDVITRANALPYGLGAYVFTSSVATATRASEGLEAEMVGVNDMLLAAAEAPFGGSKESGFGREGGQLGILDYLEPKHTKLRVA
jgi:succinate-semialdehyde dehydrogenase/glutarate-semialdehyde dehydrogenase